METEIIDENHRIDWHKGDIIGILYERQGDNMWRSIGGIPRDKLLVDNWFLVERLKEDKMKKYIQEKEEENRDKATWQ